MEEDEADQPKKRGRRPKSVENHATPARLYTKQLSNVISYIKQCLNTNDEMEVGMFITYMKGKFNIPENSPTDVEDLPHLHQICQNIGKFYNQIHVTSPIVYSMIKTLSENVPTSIFSEYTTISSKTVTRAREKQDNLFVQEFPTNINRTHQKKFQEDEIEQICYWIRQTCPVPSGSKYPKHYQYMTDKDLYTKFLSEPSLPKVSKSTFLRAKSLINIRIVNFDFTTSCPYCDPEYTRTVVDESDDSDEESNKSSDTKSFEEHQEYIQVQSGEFKRTHDNLGENEMLIVMDFTSVAVPWGKSKSLFVNDLIITIYEKNKPAEWVNYMSTSDDKQMFDYVEGAIVDFWETYIPKHITKIVIFSDGGPHHFKIWSTINLFHYLVKLYRMQIAYNFFESYHGASLCDAHAGHVKRAIRYLIQDGTKIMDLHTLVAKLKERDLKNATFEILVKLQESIVTEVKKVNNLRKYYKFDYDGKEISLYKKSTDLLPAQVIKFAI
jgi:hypothetical protein